MKLISQIVLSLCLGLLSFQAQSAPHLYRQWSRNTLVKPHYGFRNLHRMPPLLTPSLVIQGNATDGIKAFNRNSGQEVWSFAVEHGVEGGATLDEHRLYFGGNDGIFYCLDVNTGKVLWKHKVNSESLTQPLVEGAFVYHVTGNNTLYALDKKTGQSLWVKTNAAKSNMTVRGQTSPVYDTGVLYLGFSDGAFVAINAQNGRELWSKRIGDDKKFNDVDARAVISGQCILVASYANALYCLDKTNGNIRWRHDQGGYQAVLVDGDLIYYPTVDSEIHVLDESSGKLVRKVINIKGIASEIVALDSFLIYGESGGTLKVRQKGSLDSVAEFNSGLGVFARPTVDPETKQVYLMSRAGNLFRLDFREKKENAFLWSQPQ